MLTLLFVLSVFPPRNETQWAPIDKLISEQKLEAASEAVAKLRAESTSDADIARTIIKEVQLRIALHGYEKAVRFMRDTPWPKEALARAVLNMYYGYNLITYLHSYGYEIAKREKIEAQGVDLKAWTKEQIFTEALRAYDDAWAQRDALGELPANTLEEFVSAGSYPATIRPSLRDVVVHLAIGLLQNTGNWRADESNDLFRIDVAGLIAGGKLAAPSLADTATHPAIKIGWLLDDLEKWHQAHGRSEAALDARFERYRFLLATFVNDKRAVQTALRQTVNASASLPWSSIGSAMLVETLRDIDKDLPAARALADTCAQKYPQTIGGQRCASMRASIEHPSYQVSGMASDGLSRRSLQIQHKNLKRLYFRAYPQDLLKLIEGNKRYSLLPDHDQVTQLLKQPAPISWSVDLPETPDYEMHTTFVTPQLKAHGLHVILASANPEFSTTNNRVVGSVFIASNLVPLSKSADGQLEVTVLAGDSGKPVTHARVLLYRYDYDKGHKLVSEATVDTNGHAVLKPKVSDFVSHFFVVRAGDDVMLDPQYLSFYRQSENSAVYSAFVYTDRSVYRPQQKVQWKVLSYSGRDGKFQVDAQRHVQVGLYDPNNQLVASTDVTTNAFGTAAGAFDIPTGRLLGQWTVRTSDTGAASIRVEEYKRPTFEVTLQAPLGGVRLNKPLVVKGDAKYFFGLPVASGKVRWSLKREPVYPWWWFYWNRGGATQAQQIASGVSTVGTDGVFEIKVTPEADERAGKEISYRYALHADLTDEGGETRSADRAFHLGFVAVKAEITSENQFFLDSEKAVFNVTRSNLDGDPRSGSGKYRVFSLQQPQRTVVPSELPLPEKKGFSTPGDLLRPRQAPAYSPDQTMALWPDGKELKSGTLTHNAAGKAEIDAGKLAPGAYRVRYETADEFGAKYDTFKQFIVAGERTPLALPGLFLVQSTHVPVGGTARFLVSSGLSDQLMRWERFAAGKLVDTRYLTSGSAQLIALPMTEADRGGFGATLTAVRDHQVMSFTQTVFVPWDNKELQLELETFRDLLRPGQRETWRIKVKAKTSGQAEAKSAEVLGYMFDKSLDLFGPHAPPNPLGVYPSNTAVRNWRNPLGTLFETATLGYWHGVPHFPSLQGPSLRFYNSYGIGGLGTRGVGRGGGGRAMARREAPSPSAPAMERSEKKSAKMKDEEVADALSESGARATPEEPEKAPAPAGEVRTNFAETAFFTPQLVTDGEGAVSIEFTVPDSVTSYHVWLHAVTQDFRAGSLTRDVRAVKELMVRPYLPRFMRESDTGELKVVVNNASGKTLSGVVAIEVTDPETNRNLNDEFGLSRQAQTFSVKPDGGNNVSFPFVAPKRVGQVAFKVVARAGDLSDGELRPMPVLPSRMHLAQSRFVTLRDKAKRTMVFDDLKKNDDPTRLNEQMVVNVDAQLFYSVLKALPYLISYPYECLEQTMNRFMSAGIVSSIYKEFPQIAAMASKMSDRQTALEKFDAPDANRKMGLEESPWLQEAKGGNDEALINVLNPAIATANRTSALAKIRKAQLSSGAWPWFAGGPPSSYITLYLLYGFAKAAEFKVDVPKDMVQRAWAYVASDVRNNVFTAMRLHDCCWETVTFVNYVLSAYPDASWHGDAFTADERKMMLEFSYKHWRQHSPMLKSYLALTLKRMGRQSDGVKVFESVMDSAKTAEDQGTFWAQEDRSWLWYNDTIESHAMALRTLTELQPQNAKRDGLVLWLLLNKKLNHWKSTRATAEVIYSLAHYMRADKSLGVREEALVTAGSTQQRFVFEPTEYQGKSQLVIAPTPEVTVEKETKGFMFASAVWHFSTDKLPTEDRGDFFKVSRTYYKRENGTLKPVTEYKVGDELEVHLSLRTKHEAEYVHLRDPRGAGYEPENQVSKWHWDMGIAWYEEVRDSGTNFFFEKLPVGEYTFKYRVRAAMSGKFRVGPAQVQSMYAPEFTAYSAGHMLTVVP